MMLHLIAQTTVDDCVLQRIGHADVVVLIDAAVLRALCQGDRANALVTLLLRARCCVLQEHLTLYGIAMHELVSGIEVIDYSGLVNLTVAHTSIQSWC